MPANKTTDLFKPQQPLIPGVSAEKQAERNGQGSESAGLPVPLYTPPRKHLLWIGLTLACVLGAGYLGWHQWASANQATAPAVDQPPAQLTADKPKPKENLPVGPGVIATKNQLEKTWSAKRFYFRDPITLQTVSAIVVHLPDGTFWGFSLRAPFGSCELEYVTDLRKLQATYGFSADHPMVGNPCDGTVFDLTRYGNGPNGLVRGEIEKGPGVRPPLAIEVQQRGGDILAVRMEH